MIIFLFLNVRIFSLMEDLCQIQSHVVLDTQNPCMLLLAPRLYSSGYRGRFFWLPSAAVQ